MSFRIRDINSVHNNPLNKSISKQQYSIPKADRFKRCNTVLSDKYYEIPSTNDLKAASFSQGKRQGAFEIKCDQPSPGQYNITEALSETRKITFAHGRDECRKDQFLNINKLSPGPAAYNPNPELLLKTSSRFSIKLEAEPQRRKDVDTPGPGAYPLKSSWLEKDKVLSTVKNPGCVLMRGTDAKRLHSINETLNTPFYYPRHSYKGKQTFNTSSGFSMGKSERFKRNARAKTEVPGPGSYDQFSEFI